MTNAHGTYPRRTWSIDAFSRRRLRTVIGFGVQERGQSFQIVTVAAAAACNSEKTRDSTRSSLRTEIDDAVPYSLDFRSTATASSSASKNMARAIRFSSSALMSSSRRETDTARARRRLPQ